MTSIPPLRPATPEDVADTLSFALHYEGRKWVQFADDTMARITTERLLQYIARAGYVLMKGPSAGCLHHVEHVGTGAGRPATMIGWR